MERDELFCWGHDPANIKKYRALRYFALMTGAGVDLWCVFQPAGVYESLVLYVRTGDKSADCTGKCIIEEFRKAGYHGGYIDSYAHAKKYMIEWAEIINRQGG